MDESLSGNFKDPFRLSGYVAMEKENHKIQKYSDSEMVTRIRKVIDEKVRSED